MKPLTPTFSLAISAAAIFSKTESESAPAHLTRMQKSIYQIIEQGDGEISSVSYFSVLYQRVCLLLRRKKENKLLGFIKDVYDRHRVPELIGMSTGRKSMR